MGWGVEQDEAFPELLQQKLGLKVLNAGVSSYGTVRELINFERQDQSNLKYLIIQYYHNDYKENLVFLKNDGKLPVMSEEAYRDYVRDHTRTTRYFFGKYFLEFIGLKAKFLAWGV